MKQTTLPIPIDADKLDAIRQFSSPEKPPIEAEILTLVEKIYIKTVPEPVRRFIENRAREADAEPPIRRKDRSAAQEKLRIDADQVAGRIPDNGDDPTIR